MNATIDHPDFLRNFYRGQEIAKLDEELTSAARTLACELIREWEAGNIDLPERFCPLVQDYQRAVAGLNQIL